MKRPQPGIGESDFRTFREKGYYYVDKSLLIEEIWNTSAKILLLPRPRRFGKTLNLSMLRHFFEDPPPSSSKIKQGPARELFRGLAIETSDCMKLQGRYPLIYITFKDIKQLDFDACYRKTRDLIAEEYGRHRRLLEAPELFEEEKEEYRSILTKQADQAVLENSLRKLAEYLHRVTGRKPVLLMDEYDTPIIAGYTEGYYNEVVGLMRNLIGGPLKDSEHLEKAVVTGVLRVAKESLFSGLNNIMVAGVLSEEFADKFGFTEPETEQLLADLGASEHLPLVREWYNGYRFGNTLIYNPWSILNFMMRPNMGCRPYWVNTSSVDLIRDLIALGSPELHADLERVIRGESIEKAVDDHTSLRDIENDENALWSLLTHAGYLKPTGRRVVEPDDIIFHTLTVPNREVSVFYRDVVTLWLKESFGDHRLERMLKALTAGEIDDFGDILGDIVASVLSFQDPGKEKPERVYHAFVLGMLVQLGSSYLVDSNRESGYGRYDVMIIPRDVTKLGLVLEFKKYHPRKDESMEAALDNALSQIKNKNYAARLRDAGVSRILGVGIVFKGKEVAVASAEL